jgi:carboxyl-terminal processing protease
VSRTVLLAVLVGLLAAPTRAPAQRGVYVKDIRFALDALEKECGHFFRLKDIDWRRVRKQFLSEARKVKSDTDHWVLLVRLMARLEDGHAHVEKRPKTEGLRWPEGEERRVGPGMFWCRIGGKIHVKNSWSAAADSGIRPGMEVVKVNGEPVDRWLDARVAELSDLRGYSTPHQAFFVACTWGLADKRGTRMKLELNDLEGRRHRKTITYRNASAVRQGPAFLPCEVKSVGDKDLEYGKLASGRGYIHLRRCPTNLPALMDEALGGLGDVPGLILDFRGNSGGGFDHDAFMGRFVPAGKTISFGRRYRSAGPRPYGGPIVVIVDATVVSAGETASGIFKEDGRAYMIGESPTAGMSSQKKTIELPSGLFGLYVSVRSNKERFNKGRGIEGIGVIPHEIVEFDPKDLAAGKDTLILRAEALLERFPRKQVPYDPKDFARR